MICESFAEAKLERECATLFFEAEDFSPNEPLLLTAG
jgi:hypothetical protein